VETEGYDDDEDFPSASATSLLFSGPIFTATNIHYPRYMNQKLETVPLIMPPGLSNNHFTRDKQQQ